MYSLMALKTQMGVVLEWIGVKVDVKGKVIPVTYLWKDVGVPGEDIDVVVCPI